MFKIVKEGIEYTRTRTGKYKKRTGRFENTDEAHF